MYLHLCRAAAHNLASPMNPALPTAFTQGWLMMAGLIVAIGAQNAFVLRQGLLRSQVGLVVALCTASDALLIALGVFGIGAALAAAPRSRRRCGSPPSATARRRCRPGCAARRCGAPSTGSSPS